MIAWITLLILILTISIIEQARRKNIKRMSTDDRIPARPFMRPDHATGRSYLERRLGSIAEKHHGDSPEFVRRWEDQ